MVTFLAVTLLVAHGMVHPLMQAAPARGSPAAPFDPGHSWALASWGVDDHDARAAARALAWVVATLFYVAALGVALDAQWWKAAAVAAATAGLVHKATWFSSWLVVGVLIDVGILFVAIG